MKFLVHKYPRVRLSCAEQLYIKFVEDPSIISTSVGDVGQKNSEKEIDEVVSLLSEVSWDQELEPPGNVRASRNLIADHLRVHLSEIERNAPPKTNNRKFSTFIDEYQSYASLVQAAGR